MIIEKNNIQVHLEAKDCFNAIEMAGAPLILDKKVKKEYIQAVIEREKEFPTGLPTAVGVAIPHAESDFIIKETIAILTLKNPVIFKGMGAPEEAVPVSILFLLAIKDGERQLKTLQTIVKMIQDEMVLHKIKGANSPDKIYNLLNAIDQLF